VPHLNSQRAAVVQFRGLVDSRSTAVERPVRTLGRRGVWVWPALVVGGVLLAAIAVFQAVAPGYLTRQGFPLDDAWIHAVYARELARTGMLAFNPGIPATGETSPLWAIVLAPLHAITSQTATTVALTKIAGLLLHGASVFLIAFVLLRRFPHSRPEILLAAALVAGHPDFISAAVSGMEVPLATCVIGGIAMATLTRSASALAILGALAYAARPETAAMAVVLPVAFWARTDYKAALRLGAAGLAGAVMCVVVLGIRNHAVTGMYLPATFHAKVTPDDQVSGSTYALRSLVAGFADMLGYMPLFGFAEVTAIAAMTSIMLLLRKGAPELARIGATFFLTGVVYCAISFLLVEPIDPTAFYHQRYALPGVFLMAVALILIVGGLVRQERRLRLLLPVAVVIAAVAVATAAPKRFVRLASDARNIDDVQVAMGRFLHSAAPGENAWIADVGAVRFFGQAYVVDLVGLNSPELFGPAAQRFLDEHPPRYLDVFKSWSEVPRADAVMPVHVFQTTTPYTVSSFTLMRQHFLLTCEPGIAGRIETRRGKFTFRCAT
jgi:hypothetical protein